MFCLGRRNAVVAASLLCSSLCSLAVADEPAPAEPAPAAPAAAQPAPQTAPAPAAVVAPAPATPDRKDDMPRPSFKLCIGIGAGALASLITGAALGGVAKSRESEQNGDVSAPPLYTQDVINRGKQAESIAIAGYTFLGIGGALAIADLVLWIERARKAPAKKPQASLGRSVATAPSLSVQASGLGVSF
jgi:hypothetical protein